MAKRKTPASAAPVSHHQSMGMAAHAAMQHLGSTGQQSAAADPMAFLPGAPAVHEDFTPRAYRRKPNPQG